MATKHSRITPLAIAAVIVAGMLAPGAASASEANIDATQPRSLTVHVFEQNETTGTATTGEKLPGSATDSLVPLSDVEITARRVSAYDGKSLDLTTTGGWDAIPADVFDPAQAVFTDTFHATSDANGAAVFADMPLGLFWVTQENTSADTARGMEPFLVTLPLGGGGSALWTYDVHAYPKNSLSSASMAVDDREARGLGDQVTWSTDVKIPYLGQKHLATLAIVDSLPPETTYARSSVRLVDAAGKTQSLTAADYTVAESGSSVTVTVLLAGLAKLEAAQGGTFSLDVTTAITQIGDGTIINRAAVTLDEARFDVQAQTTWGALDIINRTRAGARPLGGTRFQVFASEADGIAKTNAIAVAGQTTFTTSEAGRALVDGLKAEPTGTEYWVAEVAPAAGFMAESDNIVKVTALPGPATAPVEVLFHSAQLPAPVLPRLGNTGLVATLVIGGLMGVVALSLLGAAFIVASKRMGAK